MRNAILFALALLAFACRAAATELDFGELQPRTETTRRIVLENEGTNVVVLASVRCGPGVDAAIARDCLFGGEKTSLNVTVKTGSASGSFETFVELRAVGVAVPWRRIAVKGEVVDGEAFGESLADAMEREVWKCGEDAALLERGRFGDAWRAVYDANMAVVKDYDRSPRDRYVARRLASLALKEAYEAADDEWSTQFHIPKPQPRDLDADALAAYDAFMARVKEKMRLKKEAEERLHQQYLVEDAERKRQREMKQKEWEEKMRRQNEAFAAQQKAKQESEAREKAYAHWTPPEYFTEKFVRKTWLKFIQKELGIPDGKHSRGYRDVLAKGFIVYAAESENPFAAACQIIKTNNVWSIDRRCRCGRELHSCFCNVFAGGGMMRVKIEKDGEEPYFVKGNIAAAEKAVAGRQGDMWRFIGYMWEPLYWSGQLHRRKDIDESLAAGLGDKGVKAALDWCRGMANDTPDDDTWQKCAYPFLWGAFVPHPDLLKVFLEGARDFLPPGSWLDSALKADVQKNNSATGNQNQKK